MSNIFQGLTGEGRRGRSAILMVLASEDFLAKFLKVFPGRMFCPTCLRQMLSFAPNEMRDATERLLGLSGFKVETDDTLCSNCQKAGMVVGFVPPRK